MNRSTLHAVLRHAGGLAADLGSESDADLLRRFAATRSADEGRRLRSEGESEGDRAFAELLRRHGPMVWAACRNLLPDPADAEDAFQATFLALVRSAGSIRRGAAVGGWLHGVAVRVAIKVKRTAARRRQREQRAADAETDRSIPESAWSALLAAVHEEVQRLPQALRTAFVMCELEGVRQQDAAAQLGWKPGTLTGRLSRARERLLERLASRGLTPVAAGGAIGLGVATAAGAVPPGLIDKVFTLVHAGGLVPPVISKLVREAMPMALSRTKLVAAAVLMTGGLTVGVGAALFPVARAEPPQKSTVEKSDQPRGPSGEAGNVIGVGSGVGLPGEPGSAFTGDPPGASAPERPGTVGRSGMASGLAARGRSPHAQWEYRFVAGADKDFIQLFTEMGNDGWEFCGYWQVNSDQLSHAAKAHPDQVRIGSGTQVKLIFKRPKGQLPPTPTATGSSSGGAMRQPPGAPAGGFGGAGTMAGPPPGEAAEKGAVRTNGARGGFGIGVGGASPAPAPGGVSSRSAPGGLGGGGALAPAAPKPTAVSVTLYVLKQAKASETAEVLKKVFADRSIEVIPEERTNSVIIRADAETQAGVKALLDKLEPAALQKW